MGALDALAPLGKTFIDAFGTSLTIQRTTRGASNVREGTRAADTMTDFAIKGIVEKWSESRTGTDGIEVVGGLKLTIPPFDVAPRSDDIVTVAGVKAKVVDVLPGLVGDEVAYYELLCEGV